MAIKGKDYDDLKRAVELLEFPSFISKFTNFVGKPIEKLSIVCLFKFPKIYWMSRTLLSTSCWFSPLRQWIGIPKARHQPLLIKSRAV